MENDFVPYLCGGVLFSLLIELHNETTEGFHEFQPSMPKINQPTIMKNLIYAINPDYSYDTTAKNLPFKKTVSMYHSCKADGGKIIPFMRDSIRTDFDRCVRNQYEEVLKRMTKFTAQSFPTYNDAAICRLVKRTLMLIHDDSSINDNTLFFVNPNGSPMSKKDLLKKEDFNFQSFLVGTWHYIITKPTKNEDGKQTFEKLFPKSDGKEQKLDTSCLKPYAHDINVTWDEISEKSIPNENHAYENMIESPKVNIKKNLEIEIYYEGSLLTENRKEVILSNSPAIIDLNKNPDAFSKINSRKTIYKYTTEFGFKTHFLSRNEEIVRLYCNVGSLNISGTTSQEKWTNRSKLNNMRFRKKHLCTAWFLLDPYNENEYDASFLMIGDVL